MDNNPFGDLIPQQQQQQQQAANPFDDLVPQNAAQAQPPQPGMSPFMSTVTGFNTGVGRLAHGVLQPITENLLGDRVAKGSKAEAARREAAYKAASDANPFAAGAGEFVGSVAPTMFIPGLGAGGVAMKLGTGALAGAGIGAANYVNPGESRLSNAAFGAAGGALGSGIGQAGDWAIRKGAQKYAQSAIPGLVDKATDKIKSYITPEQASKGLQGNYNKAVGRNMANWNATNTLAGTLDTQLTSQGKAFDASPFAKHIQDFSENTQKMEPAVRAKYEQAIGFADHIKDQAPQSFTGAVALRQNLNQELKKYLEKNNVKATDKETTNLIKGLKASLQDTVDANTGNVDSKLLNQFKNTWESANKSHQDVTEFVKTPNPQGVLKPRVPRREALNNQTLDAGALKQYVPPGLRGNAGIDQLKKLTGSDDAARSYIMRNAIEGRGSQGVLPAYEKLSVPQRERLFANRPEGEALNAASAVRNAFPESKGGLGMHLLGHSLGGLATGVATLGAAPLAKKAISKFATPQSVMRAVNFAKTPNQKAGRYLSPILASLFASTENS